MIASQLPLLVFIALAYLIGLPAFWVTTQNVPVGWQVGLFILGSYGTALAAWITLTGFRLPDEARALRARLKKWRVRPLDLAAAVGLPTAVWLVAALSLWGPVWPAGLPWVSLAGFPLIYLTNFGEEIGWRGYALPRLLTGLRPAGASLVLGLLWGGFHLSLYWSRPLFAGLFLATAPALSICLTWLFQRSGGSVPLTALLHAVYNTWAQVILPEGGETALFLAAGLLWAAAVFLLARFGPGLGAAPTETSGRPPAE